MVKHLQQSFFLQSANWGFSVHLSLIVLVSSTTCKTFKLQFKKWPVDSEAKTNHNTANNTCFKVNARS